MQAARDNDRDDDTAADRMLAAMRESSARLNGIIQSAIDAIITVDDRQAIVIFNPAAEKMFGCAASEAMGTPLEQFIPARFREAHRRHINRFGATGVTTRRMGANSEITGLRANGEEFPLEAAISQVVVGGKKLFSVILRDIGERKQTERALKDSAERYQRLVELIPDPIWIEREGCITFANPACAQLLGATSPAQIIGKSPLAFIHPELHALTAARRAHLSAGGVVNPLIEKQLVRLNAEVRDVEMTETSFHEEGKLVIVAVVRDVTERKRVQRDLQESGAQLRRLSASLQAVREEEKARIARELHDELGQALTGLKMDLAQLQVQLQPQQAEAIKRADAMKRLLDHTVASVRRIATELRPLMLDDLGLLATIEWLVNDFSQRTGIAVDMQLPDGELNIAPDISIALFRVLQESLTNVARHAGATQVRVVVSESDTQLQLEVQDNGKGIGPSAGDSQKTLGLLGMRERATILGGSFTVDSAAGAGTAIVMTIPRRKA